MQVTYRQPQNSDHTSHQQVCKVLLLLLPLDGSSRLIIILYALEIFFVQLVSAYFSFLLSCFFFFYLLIPKSPSDYFTVEICVQLKSIAKHQRVLCILIQCCRKWVTAHRVGILRSVIVNSA